MKILLEGGSVVDVFTGQVRRQNVLIADGIILGVGDYTEEEADRVLDITGRTVCPGLIDGHIHLESTMLRPSEFARIALAHGTTAVITDPHEIANVCGTDGIEYMLQCTEGLPLDVFVMLPSCVPATGFDDSMEEITAAKLLPFFGRPRVLGLAEMMNYVGTVYGDPAVLEKLEAAKRAGLPVDGHAPMLTGKLLDAYVRCGVDSDHECSNAEEAMEKLSKGQWIMIRRGTAARNLESLAPLFDGPGASRCLLCTDDREPSDLMADGHIDNIIREAVQLGKDPVTAIRMATINAAVRFGLKNTGAVAPGYRADLCIVRSLESMEVETVFKDGVQVVENGSTLPFAEPAVEERLVRTVTDSVRVKPFTEADFRVEPEPGKKTRVMELIPGQLLTRELREELDFSRNGGIDTERDILKIAVIERHRATGKIGLGYIKGIGLKKGAIASTVSHDSHNIIVIGTSDADMAAAAARIAAIGGGDVVVENGRVTDEMVLDVAGLMSSRPIETVAEECTRVRRKVHDMGVPAGIAPFMNMAFVSLPVIPSLKLTAQGLVDVDRFERVSLFTE